MNQMRVLESPIGNVIPVTDIADAIGYSRSALTKIMKDQENLFGGTKVFSPLPTSGGVQQFLCINRAGLDIVMVLLKPAKSRDSFEKFLKFREEALNRLGGDITENKPTLTNNGNGDLKHEIERARLAAEATGGNLAEFQKIALKKCGFEEYIPALNATSMIHGETGWHNPSSLITLCNDPDLTPERLNFYLRNKGFQYKDGYIWRLTPEGMEHGEEYWYTSSSKHSEIRIRWRDSVLYASGLLKRQSDTLALSPARVS